MTAPHFNTVAEVKSAIKRIEHNASGEGAPSGKKAGPPSIAGGSTSNIKGSDSKVPHSKGGEDI